VPVIKAKVKVQPILFLQEDERLLTDRLRMTYPALQVIDGIAWPTPEPPIARSIEECTSWCSLLWIGVPEKLPCVWQHDRYIGPQTKWVIRVMRSQVKNGVLVSGQVDASYDAADETMTAFSKCVFREITRMRSGHVTDAGGKVIRAYAVGPSAAARTAVARDLGSGIDLHIAPKQVQLAVQRDGPASGGAAR